MRAPPLPCPQLGVLGPCRKTLFWKMEQMPPGYDWLMLLRVKRPEFKSCL